MKKMMLAVISILVLLTATTACYAQRGAPRHGPHPHHGQRHGDWDRDIRSRVRQADDRIDMGSRRGWITRGERKRLKGELNQILRRVDRMKRDGRLDSRDRNKIHNDLDRLERNISRQMRDGDRRGPAARRR